LERKAELSARAAAAAAAAAAAVVRSEDSKISSKVHSIFS
jgi:hypothetical protein